MGISCLVGSHHEKRGGGRGGYWEMGRGNVKIGNIV